MRKKSLLSHPYTLFVIACVVITAFFIMFNVFKPLPTQAIPGSIVLNVNREAGFGGLREAQVEVKCDGGDFTVIGTTNNDGVFKLGAKSDDQNIEEGAELQSKIKKSNNIALGPSKAVRIKSYKNVNYKDQALKSADFYIAQIQQQECPRNCASCNDLMGRCDKCMEGFTLSKDGSCSLGTQTLICDPNCIGSCDINGGGMCDSECNDGFFLNSHNNCVHCDKKCMTCDGPERTNCTSCGEGRVLANGECVCADGTVELNGECQPCDRSCQNCSGINNNECTSCSGDSRLVDGVCVAETPSLICDPSCKECKGGGVNECTSCYEGSSLQDGYCENNKEGFIPASASCDNGDSIIFRITKDGYVTKTTDGSNVYSLSDDNNYTINDVQFAIKVEVNDELGRAINGANLTLNDQSPAVKNQQQDQQLDQQQDEQQVQEQDNQDEQQQVSGEDASTNLYYFDIPFTLDNLGKLSIGKAGFINGEVTNKIFNNLSFSSGSQTFVKLGDYSVNDGAEESLIYGEEKDKNYSAREIDARGLEYSQKVTILSEIGQPVTPDLVMAGNPEVECVISGNIAYCPVVYGNGEENSRDIRIEANGFVTNNSGSTVKHSDSSDSQKEITIDNLVYAYKISSIMSEDGWKKHNLTSTGDLLEVGNNQGLDNCNFYKDNWYCPVKLEHSSGKILARFVKDGYVDKSNYLLNGGKNRQYGADNQIEDSISNIETNVKVTLTDKKGSPISGATVMAGERKNVSCFEKDSLGIYCCPVSLDDGGQDVLIIASGYDKAIEKYPSLKSKEFKNNQLGLVVGLTSTSSSSLVIYSGSRRYSEVATTANATVNAIDRLVATEDQASSLEEIMKEVKDILQAPVVKINRAEEVKPNAPTTSPASGAISSLSYSYVADPNYSKIIEKVITPNTKEETKKITSNFIINGTESTSKLGVKERANVISSYQNTYGKIPETKTEWTDVLKVANGRWPSSTVPEKEKTFEPVFERIYQRAPNIKSEKEKNAISIMTYGIRPAQRNVNSELKAVNTFLTVFGHLPNSPRDWDIVRGVAYSGVKR